MSWAPDPNPNQFLNKRVAKLTNNGTVTASSVFSLPGIRDDIDGLAWNPTTNEMWVEDFNHFFDGEGFRLGRLNDPFGAGYSVTNIRPNLVRNLDTGDIAIGDTGRVFTLNRLTNSLQEVVGDGFVTIGPLGNNPDYDGTWSSLAFVPEPASLVLVALGALALRRR
ncbi:MAG: PEP-CTERM sorting domain-containing protein [Phycisphaerales bacterium]|nr:PEP-CTERM sorting domain-containing protein [Phycisphaerales bacterium]